MVDSEQETIGRQIVMMWACVYMSAFTVLALALWTYFRTPVLALITLGAMFAIPKLFRPQIVRFLRWDLYR